MLNKIKKIFPLFLLLQSLLTFAQEQQVSAQKWIRLSYQTSSPGGQLSLLNEDTKETLYTIKTYKGNHELDIPLLPGTYDPKDKLAIISSDRSLKNTEIKEPPSDIMLTDIAVILQQNPAEPLAVYRWAALPDFLILDFETYKLQSAYLRRIAFFAEKPGYVGRIADPAELADKHDWNAHDYPAKALAAFYTTAKKQDIPLLAEEEELLNILLASSILSKSTEGYEPLSGGIISISRESYPQLKKLLLIHESLHALYFSLPSLRADIYNTWEALTPDTIKTFTAFMDWMNYDTNKYPLVATEFFAYMLQQDIEQLSYYIQSRILPRAKSILGSLPGDPAKTEAELIQAAKKMENALQKHYPFSAGDTSLIIYKQ